MELPAHIKLKHFLICDDYESIRVMITDSLKSIGVSTISQSISGNQGYAQVLANATKNPIEFIVTDLMMEDGSGIDLAKLIRSNPETKHIPILMVTSKSEVNLVLDSIKAGVNNYIVKPWTPEDLCKKIVEIDKKLK